MNKPPKKSLLINPIVSRQLDETHRAATPLELFFDLVYVVAIAFLAGELHHALSAWHHVGQTIGLYFFIFFTVWWSWNIYTWFASAYDTDDAQFRLASFAQMVGVIIIAVGVKPAFATGDFGIILVGYLVMRAPYLLLWAKVAVDDEVSRPVALRYIIGFTLTQLSWVTTVLFYPNWFAFIALVFLEMLVPYVAESAVAKGQNTKHHFDHIEERMGLLTIIVLGESVLASVKAFETLTEHYSTDMALLAGGSLMILFSMWWLYFDDKLKDRLADEKRAFLWGYGHYFIFASVVAVGALIAVNVDVLSNHAGISENTAVIVLLIAVLTHSVLLMGIAFVTLNIVRLLRQHRSCQSNNIQNNP